MSDYSLADLKAEIESLRFRLAASEARAERILGMLSKELADDIRAALKEQELRDVQS